MPAVGRTPRRVALAALLGAACALALTAPPGARAGVEASTGPGGCVGDEGVTVVVDFGVLGGGVQTGCAPEPVTSGFEALTGAGFTYAGTTRFPGLLCRIDGKPSPQQDACHNAPRPDFYWAYWTAPEPGAPWTYSDLGAGNRDPEPGSVEGWAFSDGCKRQPGAATGCPKPSGSSTTTVTSPGPSPQPGATSPPTVRSAASSRAPSEGTVPADPVSGSAPPTAGGSTPAPAGRDHSNGDLSLGDLGAEPANSSPESGSGSATGVLVGAAIAAALAAVATLRRRRADAGPGAGE